MALRSSRRFIAQTSIKSGMMVEFKYTKMDSTISSYSILVIDPDKNGYMHGLLIDDLSDQDLIKLAEVGEDAVKSKLGKIKLYTDPGYFGAEIDDRGFDSLPVTNIPANQLVGFEPDAKMSQPKSKDNVKNIMKGLESGNKLPPILVRKYKNGYQVLDGHHRFWAYKLLKIKSIPSRIVPDENIEEISSTLDERAAPLTNLQSNAAYQRFKSSEFSEARRYRTFLIGKMSGVRQILIGEMK